MVKIVAGVASIAVVLSLAAGPAVAQSSDLPPGVFMAGKTLGDATAGTYELDPLHTAVLARVSHLRYSYSVFRFDTAAGKLTWDPAAPEKSTLSITVKTGSITSNVEGFAETLAGDKFLKSASFPDATFVSTSFKPTDALRGKVEGRFTLMGKTRPVTFDVELVGAGKGFGGSPRLGVHARAWINPQDYGLPPIFSDPIEIVTDAEFGRAP
jgi:polyisoprenoid-binding protein YceI